MKTKDERKAKALREYSVILKDAWTVFDAATKPADEAHDTAIKAADEIFELATQPADAIFDATIKPAWAIYLEIKQAIDDEEEVII